MAHGESINLSLCGKYITLLQENEKKIGYWRVMYVILFAMGAEVLVSSPFVQFRACAWLFVSALQDLLSFDS